MIECSHMEEEGETVIQKHKREQKELQARIQSLKHSIPKGDKKRKKQVGIEIAKLEAELEERHAQELKEIDQTSEELSSAKQQDDGETTEISSAPVTSNATKQSKAQRRREKKEAEEKARQKRLEEGEKEAASHSRNVEAEKFQQLLQEKNLKIIEVNPDGDCLYNSILLQLTSAGDEISLKELRAKTSEFMLAHSQDFIPFTSNPSTGDILTQDEYQSYCDDVRNTNAWGGELELRAISQIYRQPIEVYQADARLLCIGEEFEKMPIRLSYHRHQYGLGEHYNCVVLNA